MHPNCFSVYRKSVQGVEERRALRMRRPCIQFDAIQPDSALFSAMRGDIQTRSVLCELFLNSNSKVPPKSLNL